MTAFHLGPMAPADTETTSTDVKTARILTICLALVVPGRATDIRSAVINPGIPIPPEASAVNGLTDEYIQREGKPPAEILDLFAADITLSLKAGFPLIVMNAPFDLTILDRECRRHALPTIEDRLGAPIGPVIDPMVLDKQAIRWRKRVSPEQGARCLKTLAQVHGVGWDDEAAHTAEYDALQAARVAWRISQRAHWPAARLMREYGLRYERDAQPFRALAGMTLSELHTAQVRWHAEQTESFRSYLQREAEQKRHDAANADTDEARAIALQEATELDARVDNLSPHWPIRPHTEQVPMPI